eukprot:UN00060
MPVETFRIWKNRLNSLKTSAENNILPLCDNMTQITSSLPSGNTIFSIMYNVARNISKMPHIPQVHTDYLRSIGSIGGSIRRIPKKERRIYWTLDIGTCTHYATCNIW